MSAGERPYDMRSARDAAEDVTTDAPAADDATLVSRRRRTPRPEASTPAGDAAPSHRTAYSPDAAALSVPYPPRVADPVIAIRNDPGPARV